MFLIQKRKKKRKKAGENIVINKGEMKKTLNIFQEESKLHYFSCHIVLNCQEIFALPVSPLVLLQSVIYLSLVFIVML